MNISLFSLSAMQHTMQLLKLLMTVLRRLGVGIARRLGVGVARRPLETPTPSQRQLTTVTTVPSQPGSPCHSTRCGSVGDGDAAQTGSPPRCGIRGGALALLHASDIWEPPLPSHHDPNTTMVVYRGSGAAGTAAPPA